MSHRRLWVAASIVAFVVVVSFMLSAPRTRDAARVPAPQEEAVEAPSVALHDAFKKGTHTITGSLTAPNACADVSATATFSAGASDAGNILVAVSMPKDIGICLQIPTKINFQASVSAPANLPLTATVNGAVATTTVS